MKEDEIEARLMKVAMAIKTHLKTCPMYARFQRQVVHLMRFAEAHKTVSDLPDMKKM